MTGPYATAAETYWGAGWRGILPLPARAKKHPPKGYTGQDGRAPSFPDIYTWSAGREGEGNIALRMPPHVIGIDVDDYGDKHGAQTLDLAEAAHGVLPPTWRTTSRDDGVSGIRLYRIPEGLAWPGEIGPSIELIRVDHRYAVVWPSLHPEGRTYRWISPDGLTSTAVPDPDHLPLLPQAWVEAYTGGALASHTPRNRMPNEAAAIWLTSLPGANAEPCRRMLEAVRHDVSTLQAGIGSAHDAACRATSRFVRLAAEGHPGVLNVMGDVHKAFTGNVTNPRRKGTHRSALEAHAEWRDLILSAVNLVSADMPPAPSCDCDGALTALIVNERPTSAAPVDGSTALAPAPLVTEPLPADDDSNQDAEQRSTWWPRDLGPVLSGEESEPPPTVLSREDGQPLWYAGKINGLIGESESGKTWVALEAVRQELVVGHRVLYLDFEDAAPGIVSRLRALGVSDEQLRAGLDYADPSESLHAAASGDLTELLGQRTYSLIVVDGLNAAMTLLGLDLMSNTDVTRFFQMLMRPLAKTGAVVAYVDHIGKNNQEDAKGGIGAQAKRAMTTGCVVKVKVSEPFGRGMVGQLGLIVDKDRAGHVRGNSGNGRNAGMAVLTSDRTSGSVRVVLTVPDMATTTERRDGNQLLKMEAISLWLQSAPRLTSRTAISESVTGRAVELKAALDELIRRGFVVAEGTTHRNLKPFTVADQLTTPSDPSDPVPNPSGTGSPEPSTHPVPPSHPFRWDGDGWSEVGSGTTDVDDVASGRGQEKDRGAAPAEVLVACTSCYSPTLEVIANTWGGLCGKCASKAGLV